MRNESKCKKRKMCFVFTLQVCAKQVKAYKVSSFAAVKSGFSK